MYRRRPGWQSTRPRNREARPRDQAGRPAAPRKIRGSTGNQARQKSRQPRSPEKDQSPAGQAAPIRRPEADHRARADQETGSRSDRNRKRARKQIRPSSRDEPGSRPGTPEALTDSKRARGRQRHRLPAEAQAGNHHGEGNQDQRPRKPPRHIILL